MSMIDDLVSVGISVSNAGVTTEGFSTILLVAPVPEVETAPAKYAEYGALSEISKAGFGSDSDVYKAASVAFGNGASKVCIATKDEDEDISDVLDYALECGSWYGLALIGLEDDYDDAAIWVEANEKLLGITTNDKSKAPVGATYNNTHCWYGDDTDNKLNKFIHIAVMAKCFGYEAGSETWAYKSLSVIPASNLTPTERNALDALNVNYYVECAGSGITRTGKTASGEWIDIIRGKAWLKNDMQTRIYNLFVKNPKVPFTSSGIALIQNQMLASLKLAQSNGLISQDEYDEDDNLIPGYTVNVPTISSTAEADRAARNLSACTFTARLAGAIHVVAITGNLTF